MVTSDKLPVLISIPHGGLEVPTEVQAHVGLNAKEVFENADAFTQKIFDLEDAVEVVVAADVARTFVDMNRAPDAWPQDNPNGVVKALTFDGKPVFGADRLPDPAQIRQLLDRYYHPYHQRIRAALKGPNIQLALDCHSMAEVGPEMSPDPGQPRPLICLGNAHDQSCERRLILKLSDCFSRAFRIKETDVSLNQPFAGGYITQAYGMSPIPWVQVELNQALYLRSPWFDAQSLSIDAARLEALRNMFHQALELFFDANTVP